MKKEIDAPNRKPVKRSYVQYAKINTAYGKLCRVYLAAGPKARKRFSQRHTESLAAISRGE